MRLSFAWKSSGIQPSYCCAADSFPMGIIVAQTYLQRSLRGNNNNNNNKREKNKKSTPWLTFSLCLSYPACNESIGLQDGRIRDSQLSASPYFSLTLGRGQLYMTPQYGRVGNAYAWCSQVSLLPICCHKGILVNWLLLKAIINRTGLDVR